MAPIRRFCPRGLALGILLALVAAGVSAEERLHPNHPERYVVRAGDTLWDIAGRFLREPWRWGEIWDANPDIADPDLIYPGDVLVLTYRDGRPRIGVESGRLRTVRLTPRVRVEALDEPIPTIPANVIAPFLTRVQVTGERDLDQAPYVVGFPDEHIVGGVRDSIYVRAITTREIEQFLVVRSGQAYRDPDTGRVLGYEAAHVANVELERPGDPARLRVRRSMMEVAIGDRLVPADETEALRQFIPRPAPPALRGRIIAVLNGVSQIGQYNIVVLNRGSEQGVERGHVFDVYQGGYERPDQVLAGAPRWRDVRSETPLSTEFWYGDHQVIGWRRDRPDANTPFPLHVEVRRPAATYVVPYERSGTLMVFRVFPQVSFALVMSAERAMNVQDSVSAPET
ncbi:LysM domain-containing protein [Thioalkalicoccus limnaeus]|uniref:LysM domain-containing protein n=1 Tax=Thioalkalicoccus limnaeus TaxID=120681 RepID=A0ABV4BGB8_9GAMM